MSTQKHRHADPTTRSVTHKDDDALTITRYEPTKRERVFVDANGKAYTGYECDRIVQQWERLDEANGGDNE